jgi:hypothetical protein
MVGTVARLCYFKCMAELSTTLLRRRILSECSGECGDLGTFIPRAIGAITVSGLAPAGVLLGFAVLFIATGLFYGLPLPAQPMKAPLLVDRIRGRDGKSECR